MQSVYLINYNEKDKKGKALILDYNTEIGGVEDIVKKAINKSKIIDISSPDFNKCNTAIKSKINYTIKGGKIVIESPTTKALLNTNALTIILIYENLIGERLGFICVDANGKFYNIDIKTFTDMSNKYKGFVNNAFIKNGGIQFYQGNYKEVIKNGEKVAIPLIPSVIVGKAVEEKIKDVATQKISLKTKNLSAPVKAMITAGYINEVKTYKLYNPAYKEETLWFYYSLLKNGRGMIIPKMLTTKDFTEEQLNEVAEGIIDAVDVNKYFDPAIDYAEMKRTRENLKRGMSKYTAIPTRIRKAQIALSKSGGKDRTLAANLSKVNKALMKATDTKKKKAQTKSMSEEDKLKYEIKDMTEQAASKYIRQYERNNGYEDGEYDYVLHEVIEYRKYFNPKIAQDCKALIKACKKSGVKYSYDELEEYFVRNFKVATSAARFWSEYTQKLYQGIIEGED